MFVMRAVGKRGNVGWSECGRGCVTREVGRRWVDVGVVVLEPSLSAAE